jgi:arylsulfatase I/J
MHSGQAGLCGPSSVSCGAPYHMGTIAEKLVAGGMKAHFVGKWDVGMATPTHTPHGRGYNSPGRVCH